jgi:hypothetical protein
LGRDPLPQVAFMQASTTLAGRRNRASAADVSS